MVKWFESGLFGCKKQQIGMVEKHIYWSWIEESMGGRIIEIE